MPVVPIFAAIGGAFGASAATAATTGMLITSSVVGLAGTAYAVTKDIQAGNEAKKLGTQQQQADVTNAAIVSEQADAQAKQIQLENAQVRKRQEAAFLSSGVTLDGTAQDVIYGSSVEGELNELNTRYKGQIGAYSNLTQANIDRQESLSKAKSYDVMAAGSVLTGVGQQLSIYSNPNFNPKTSNPMYYDN